MHNIKINEPQGINEGLWFVPLGGAGEIGMNLNLYGCDDKWLMVDLGVTFGDQNIPGVDIVMPDPKFIENRKDKLLGLILTHAHEDHLGAVPFLWPKLQCPIYTTPFTAEFLRRKLIDYPSMMEIEINEIPLSGNIKLAPFDIEFISITHSIPEPNSLAIHTPYGRVFHSGDWKFDDYPIVGNTPDYSKLKHFGDKGVLAMVGDSTNALTPGVSGSESEVQEKLKEIVSKQKGQVAIGCFASNLARIHSIVLAARENDREVALVGRSLWRLVDTAQKTGYISRKIKFYEAEDASYFPKDKVLYICTGSQGEPRAALSRIAFGHHRQVDFGDGDTVIFSSRIIPGNEKAIYKLQNQFSKLNVNIITSKDENIHVSGHPARDDIRKMYQIIRPEISIPVHGEQMHMRSHAELAKECNVKNVLLVENGDAVKLRPGNMHVTGQVFSGKMAWEGRNAISFSDTILRDRKKILYNGAVFISVLIRDNSFNNINIDVSVHGVENPFNGCDNSFASELKKKVINLNSSHLEDENMLEESIKRFVRKMYTKYNKKPLLQVHIIKL